MTSKGFVRRVLAGLLLVSTLFLWNPVLAADVSILASVNRQKVAVGDIVVLTVTIRGATNVSPSLFPSIDGLRLLSTSMSSRITTGTSGFQAEVYHRYNLQALKAGKFEIPPLEFKVGGTSYTTQSLSVEVVEAATPSPSPAPARGDTTTSEKLFLRAFTDITEAYVGQQIPVTLQLCWAGVKISNPRLSPVEAKGLRRVSLSEPVQTFRTIGGSQYNVLELTHIYFPLVPGELRIGPFHIECDLLVPRKSAQRRPPSIDDFFGADIDTLFGSYVRKPVNVTADPITIDVRPIPEDAKPESFSGAVGKFSVIADVKPTDVKVGDGVTITMTVHGEGELEAATAPLAQGSDALRAFPPETSYQVLSNTDRLHTQKVFKQLVIVQDADVREIPALEFSYFDPAVGDYRRVRKGPFPIKVTAAEPSAQAGLQRPTSKKNISLLSRGLFGIRTDAVPLVRSPRKIGSSPVLFAVVLAIPALVASISLVVSRRCERLRFDSAYARAVGARKKALRGLKGADAADTDICSKVARALCGLVADKLNLSPGSVTADSIEAILRSRGATLELVGEVLETLRVCDRGRFSGRATESEETANLLATAHSLIQKLDKVLRKK